MNGKKTKPTRADLCFEVMGDCDWHTLRELSRKTKYPEASVSSQLRDFRKPAYGAFVVQRRHTGNRVFEYRLDLPAKWKLHHHA